MRGKPLFKDAGAGQRHAPENLLWWEHRRFLQSWKKMSTAEKDAIGGRSYFVAKMDEYAAAVQTLRASAARAGEPDASVSAARGDGPVPAGTRQK